MVTITREKDMLNVREASEALGVGKTLAWKLMHAGALPYHRIGDKAIRVSRADIEDYLARTRHDGPRQPADVA